MASHYILKEQGYNWTRGQEIVALFVPLCQFPDILQYLILEILCV
jgi:hypothetical protein